MYISKLFYSMKRFFWNKIYDFWTLWSIFTVFETSLPSSLAPQNSKIAFLGIFVRKLCFYWFEYVFFVLYSSKSIVWYKNKAFLTLQWNFIRQNMLKNLVKREAEGSYLGFWVSKHMYSDTFIFLSCSTQWSGSFEAKFIIFGHYGQFL